MTGSTDDPTRPAGVGEEIAGDLACLNCGYNLRGLSPKGRCPECGEAISLSTSAADNPIADRRWVHGTVVGVRMYAATLMSALALLIASAIVASFRWHSEIAEGLLHVAFAGGATVAAVAVWVSTRFARHGWGRRFTGWFWILRLVSGIAALGAVAYSVSMVYSHGWAFGRPWNWFQSISGGVGAWGIALTDAMFMVYLARLVWRLPGRLALWGYVTAARTPMLLALYYEVLGTVVSFALILMVFPAVLFIWPAMYAWIWVRRVEAWMPV